MTAQRRAFALWLGLGGGALVVLTHLITRTWPFPEADATAVLVIPATPPDAGFPIAIRLTLLLTGSTIIAAVAAYLALASVGRPPAQRMRFAAVLGVLAPLVALANIYLAYHAGPDWLYESVTTGEGGAIIHRRTRNPFFVHLLLTVPVAGALIGLASTRILGLHSAGRTLGSIAAWTIAGIVAAYVAIPVVYLLGGALTDLSEGLGIGPQPGSIVGSFLAGYVVGYVFGIVGGFSLPGSARTTPASNPPGSWGSPA